MYRAKSCMVLMVALFVLPAISSVEAQWVMAAHAVKNRVQQMTQKSENGGYDVVIVLLEAAPPAVYNKTLKSLQSHPEVTINKNDGKTGRIEISKGKQVAGFQISPLGDKLTQLVIASSVSEGRTEPHLPGRGCGAARLQGSGRYVYRGAQLDTHPNFESDWLSSALDGVGARRIATISFIPRWWRK